MKADSFFYLGGVCAAVEIYINKLITELSRFAQGISIALIKISKKLKNLLTTVRFFCYYITNFYTGIETMKKWVIYLILALLLFGLPFIAYTAEEYAGATKCKLCHIKIY